MDVGDWLRSLGLGQYETMFHENSIGSDVLAALERKRSRSARRHLRRPQASNEGDRKLSEMNRPPTSRLAPAPRPPSQTDAAERRQLTVMFCDLVGSTALSARLDPEDMRQVILAFQDACSGAVARYDGFVASFMGDGILAYFGFPRAHEDDAERAVHAGLEIAAVVAGLQTRARQPLAVRVGIATGLVVVGDLIGVGSAQEQAVVGDTPNLAARLQALAEAGGVVVAALDAPSARRSASVCAISASTSSRALPSRSRPGRRSACRQTESRFEAAHSARLTDFVGREAETAHLLALQRGLGGPRPDRADLRRGGNRQVAACPPARRADRRCAAHQAALPVLALPSRQRALSVRQAIRARGGLRSAGRPEAKLDKLEKALGLATDRLNEVAPLFASMLSIPTGNALSRARPSPGAAAPPDALGAARSDGGPRAESSRCSSCSRTCIGPTRPRWRFSTWRSIGAQTSGSDADHLSAGIRAALDRPARRCRRSRCGRLDRIQAER